MVNTNKKKELSYKEKVIQDNLNKPYRKNTSKVSFMANNFEAETIYIGSKKGNTRMFCRIYDKKKEQLS